MRRLAARLSVFLTALIALTAGPATPRSLVAQEAPGAATALRAWNSDILTRDTAPRAGEALSPIRIPGARNGSFSGKVVVASSAPIRALKAAVDDLTSGDARIPASCVRVRYGVPFGGKFKGAYTEPTGLDALIESPLEEFPAVGGDTAMASVWLTVDVPVDAKAGRYSGQLTVRAEGSRPTVVPVELSVADWAIPDPRQWRTWVEMVQSPDTLAVEYGLPMWSDRHWQMIARSMRYIGDAGSRVVYIPLICFTNFGNSESMVRWIDQGEGKFEYDLSIMDRYLDTAEKQMGKPALVIFNAWEIYMKPGEERWGEAWYTKVDESRRDSDHVKKLKARGDLHRELQAKYGAGPAVTQLDRGTGDVSTRYLPPYTDPAARELWAPLFAKLRAGMKARGLEDRMMLGMISDSRPSKEEVALLNEVSGGLPWVCHSHAGVFAKNATKLYDVADVTYETSVWLLTFDPDVSDGRSYGWKRKELVAEYDRSRFFNGNPLSTIRYVAEYNITGQQRGVGKIGADFWKAVRDRRGQRAATVTERYPQSQWRSLDVVSTVLGPGPDGPVATVRYENFREGVQECEARIFIEKALTDDTLRARLGDDLAGRCQKLLDERVKWLWVGGDADTSGRFWRYKANEKGHALFVASDWQGRIEQIYSLAGEVARSLGGK